METTSQVEQLKLNVSNINSFLISKNKEQKKLKSDKKRLELRRADTLKKEKEERKLEIKSSPVGKVSEKVKESVSSGGSILDKLLNFGGLLLAGILVNNLPAIIEKVRGIIGDYWKIIGEVIEGDKRGREIGFPTANIMMDNIIKPSFGVYAVRVNYNNDIFNGIANFGVRPTFDKTKSLPILEVHLFNFSDNLYGKEIVISFVDFIRKEKKFNGLESLKSQIKLDINIAKDLLGL